MTTISPAAACAAILAARDSGRTPSYHLSKAQIHAIAPTAPGGRIDDELRRIAGSGDAKDRRIAILEGLLMNLDSRLAAWLTDNTEDDFGEQPEIDTIRGSIDPVLSDPDAPIA